MLLFYGKPMHHLKDDENLTRFARLAALRRHFFAFKQWQDFSEKMGDTQTHAMAMALKQGATLDQLKGDPDILVLNAHGNQNSFSGFSAEEVANDLFALGIVEAGTRQLWVAACNAGLQDQKNAGFSATFTQQLNMRLKERMPEITVYGPRGIIRYGDKKVVDVGNGQKTMKYGRVYIFDKKEQQEYPFEEGWVRAGF